MRSSHFLFTATLEDKRRSSRGGPSEAELGPSTAQRSRGLRAGLPGAGVVKAGRDRGLRDAPFAPRSGSYWEPTQNRITLSRKDTRAVP